MSEEKKHAAAVFSWVSLALLLIAIAGNMAAARIESLERRVGQLEVEVEQLKRRP